MPYFSEKKPKLYTCKGDPSLCLTEIIIKRGKKPPYFYLSAGNGKTTCTASEAVKSNYTKVHGMWTLASEVISTGKP